MTVEYCMLDERNAALLESVAPDVFDNPVDPAKLRRFLTDPRHILLVATDDDIVVGMASAVECLHPDKQPELFIDEVGVAPSHRRLGIGRTLVQGLIGEAAARGCASAWLPTDSDNRVAQACFDSVPGGEKPESCVIYEWKLSGR